MLFISTLLALFFLIDIRPKIYHVINRRSVLISTRSSLYIDYDLDAFSRGESFSVIFHGINHISVFISYM